MTVQTTFVGAAAMPAPDLISNVRVRTAWEDVLRQRGLTQEAHRRMEQATRDKQNGRAATAQRFLELLDGADNVDAAFAAADAAPETQSTEAALEQARALRAAAGQAEAATYARFVATVEANATDWARSLNGDVQRIADRLVNVLKALQVAHDELHVALGFREMLEPGSTAAQGGRLGLNGAGPIVSLLDTAETPLREAIGRLVLRLDELTRAPEPAPEPAAPIAITVDAH